MGKPHFLNAGIIFIIIFELATVARAFGNSKNRFVNPPAADSADNPVWYLGEQKIVSWITELVDYEIVIWQEYPTGGSAIPSGVVFSTHMASAQNFTWTVQTYGHDLEFSNVFFFWAGRDNENQFTSNYFNISNEKPPTQTTTPTIPITITIPAPTTSLTPTSTSPQPDNNGPEQEKPGLATSTKIGLGVGLSVGVIFLAIAGFFAHRFLRGQKQKQANVVEEPRIREVNTMSELPNKHHSSRFTEPAELDGGEFHRN
ncbi:hypothetical protein MGYG_06123 [Nannizzia gypsea CBS 118893]|uniref:Mid2 domain-containing protein n=1 Tax=Arthroderma gypseum (strain ATCC MYA-4604 / CBS 118893) TaxID=535722 RepID=E4V0J2_ARTGP|nr:hypothetical protein MGYG_06123 [Nannizzia gypsea CBS 118893]EFR03129.1 hypothetical protein MGYG_06123 [Nannizzia gypsea CBS 118893]